MFHAKLLELESELLAKEEAARAGERLLPECEIILSEMENEVGLRLANKAPKDWKGWLTFRRGKNALVVCRGRSFAGSGILPHWRAGFDVVNGGDSVSEYQRGFDVIPPQELDHLLLNFGVSPPATRVFLWYGENIAPYRLVFEADVTQSPEAELKEAIVEACIWILTRPKELTLPEFLAAKAASMPTRD